MGSLFFGTLVVVAGLFVATVLGFIVWAVVVLIVALVATAHGNVVEARIKKRKLKGL